MSTRWLIGGSATGNFTEMSETQMVVRCALVKDVLGIAQCVLTTGAMLDLNSLQTHAQRKLLPMSHLDIVKATHS